MASLEGVSDMDADRPPSERELEMDEDLVRVLVVVTVVVTDSTPAKLNPGRFVSVREVESLSDFVMVIVSLFVLLRVTSTVIV